jgi:oligopeptide/dipeptide ABC transporter ATP-binding protein
MSALLDVRVLETCFSSDEGIVRAVRGVSFELAAGETLGLVGESGCGKSVTALSIMRLLPPNARVTGGSVLLDGTDLLRASKRTMRRIRGARVGMVFQDSMTALNPLLTVGRQITEILEAHTGLTERAARAKAVALLEEVGVPEPTRRLRQYPHQLSGGLRQRVAVAIALAPNPDVLIADEPTTALDVTIQAQVLDLLRRQQGERRMAMILITHDVGVVASLSDRLAVMYAGRIVEIGRSDEVFTDPRHPYTLGLLRSVPRIDSEIAERLPSIPGTPPPLSALPPGCPFRPRCSFAVERSDDEEPPLAPVGDDHAAACWVDIRAREAVRS